MFDARRSFKRNAGYSSVLKRGLQGVYDAVRSRGIKRRRAVMPKLDPVVPYPKTRRLLNAFEEPLPGEARDLKQLARLAGVLVRMNKKKRYSSKSAPIKGWLRGSRRRMRRKRMSNFILIKSK